MCDDDGVEGFPFVRRRDNIVLIGLSTGVPTAPFLATGWLGTETARRTHRRAQKTQKRRSVPRDSDPSSAGQQRPHSTSDCSMLQCSNAIIADHGAELLLHGHDHLHMINWLHGPDGTRVPAVGVPSASAAPGGDRGQCSVQSLSDRRHARRLAVRTDFARPQFIGRGRATKALHAAWLGMRIGEHGQRDQRNHADDNAKHECPNGLPATVAPFVPEHQMRAAASGIVGAAPARARPADARRSA